MQECEPRTIESIDSSVISSIEALSPLDGRYGSRVRPLRKIFSEFGLIKFRVHVEIEWLITLANREEVNELGCFSDRVIEELRAIADSFSAIEAEAVKKIERQTNHDVKALEYYLKDRLQNISELQNSLEFIHFGCTSYDINDNCFGLMLKQSRDAVLHPQLQTLNSKLSELAIRYADVPMLARTHGQPASPTTVGKELRVFSHRLDDQVQKLMSISIKGKLSGAVGNFNAFYCAYADVDWPGIAQQFVESLGLDYSPLTTQIEPHDYIAELCHCYQRINTILIDLCRDLWGYIALGYFKQKAVRDEVGSSAMPHKINPIDFENAEGNLGVANSLFSHFAEKLPISRWQRDLSDSTVLRNLGVAAGHSLISYQAVVAGLNKIEVNEIQINRDLEISWEVLSEAIQTVLRKHGSELPYEKLKSLTRGVTVDRETIGDFIGQLNLPPAEKQKLLELTPQNYIGIAKELAHDEF